MYASAAGKAEDKGGVGCKLGRGENLLLRQRVNIWVRDYFCEPESASDSTSGLMESVGDESQYLALLMYKAPRSLILTGP